MKIRAGDTLRLLAAMMLMQNALATENDILGQWQCSMTYQGNTVGSMKISFNRNGQGSMGSQSFSYRLSGGDTLLISNGVSSDTYRYRHEDEHLLMSYQDGSTFDCRPLPASAMPGGLLQAPGAGGGLQAGPGTGNEWQLRGTFCFWSGSSSYASGYSRSTHITFDGRGHWYYGSESSFSSGAGLAYGSDAGERGSYRINGDQILYTSNSGEQGTARVNMRQYDGRITEIYLGNELYSPSLCE